jgi:hypothetical protein
MALPDLDGYTELVYSLPERFPAIQSSTLVLATIGATLAKVEGQVTFEGAVVLDVWELLDFEARRILHYSYEVYRADEKVAWYDPFEHPHLPELASTYPHHKHVLPDIKHNRLPAPGLSFEQPNLPFLIEEIERTFRAAK